MHNLKKKHGGPGVDTHVFKTFEASLQLTAQASLCVDVCEILCDISRLS